jgi:hypothetical protein
MNHIAEDATLHIPKCFKTGLYTEAQGARGSVVVKALCYNTLSKYTCNRN